VNIENFKDLTLNDLFESEDINEEKLYLILRSIESKILAVPETIKRKNTNCDFTSSPNDEVMCDLTSMCEDVYHITAMLRECLSNQAKELDK